MNRIRVIMLFGLAAALAAAWLAGAGDYLTLDGLRSAFDELQGLVATNFALSGALFMAAYAVLAGLNVPGAALTFTLGAGALFGVAWGSVFASFGSTAGATLGCALSRFLLQDFVESRFPTALLKVNEGLAKDGPLYLFGLRQVALFPYFVVNLVMGVTRIPLRTFAWVSQLGMLPGTVIFVNAGTQLAQIKSTGDILTPGVAISLGLLGVFPLVAKKFTTALLAWHRGRA